VKASKEETMGTIKGYNMPDDLYFHKDHTWVRVNDDGTVTIGMTDFYSRMAGDTTYVDLPDEGDEVTQGETAGKIQSSKWVGKLISPLSGEILSVNEDLEDDYMLLNTDSYGQGWIMKIEPSDLEQELQSLYHGEKAVSRFLEAEIEKTGGDPE
jgi:glycine cleavage system H protein